MGKPLSRRQALSRLSGGMAAAVFGVRAAAQPPRRPERGPGPRGRGPAPNGAPTPPPGNAAFAGLARRHGFKPDGPGVAAFVRRDGRPAAVDCFGLADLAAKTPVTPRTTFELASVSKTVTSTAILLLAERKALALSDDVRKHLPELPEYDAGRPIRVEDLLRHTSGLPEYMGFGDVPTKHGDFATNDDYVAEYARRGDSAPLAVPTGRRHAYTNANFMLLASVAAKASGKPFREFLREAVFGPAGMTDAFVYDSPASLPEGADRTAATGYTKEGGSWQAAWGLPPGRRERLLTVGDGGIWCSGRDMAAWDAALHGGKLLSRESAGLALSPTKTPDGGTHGYGLGWALALGEGGTVTGHGHNGAWGGFVTSYWRDPAAGVTLAVLSNRGDFDVDAFGADLRELFDAGGGGRPGGGPRRRR